MKTLFILLIYVLIKAYKEMLFKASRRLGLSKPKDL